MAQRRAEGLCFCCVEKWHERHRCPRRELSVMIVHEEGPDKEWVEEDETDSDEEGVVVPEMATLSLNLMVEISSPRTMKLKARVLETEVVVMINSGASHNFISEPLVKKLSMETEESHSYGVMTGTRAEVVGKGICREVKLEMQGITVVSNFLSIELGGADVIMGIQWLGTLGEMKVNWKLQRARFRVNGQKVTIQRDPELVCAPITLKTLWKAIENQGQGVIVEFGSLQAGQETKAELTGQLRRILGEFPQVFEEPHGLPPSKGKEHGIVLAPCTIPISVRPFRYPQAQKEEIERQVACNVRVPRSLYRGCLFWERLDPSQERTKE
ncbi:hypothetical protein AALP_AA6G281200 [Arabis alpina]|uniref:Uncharacterized protein n=1 Tax=Arabis alpina TaxID=50452 RepID=A0A087GS75_ARAAL|nr:hypothetical protein AALP_AA6G281200 [Arabis alpina]